MDITNILRFAIALCTAVVTIFLIPWLHGKTSEQERMALVMWTRMAVRAAEQLCKGQRGQGALKKGAVKEFLEAKGFTVSEPEIDQAIEAAVWEMDQKLQESAV